MRGRERTERTEVKHARLDDVAQQLLVIVRVVEALVVDLLASRLGLVLVALERDLFAVLNLARCDRRPPDDRALAPAHPRPAHEPLALAGAAAARRGSERVVDLRERALVHGLELLVLGESKPGRGEDLVGPLGDGRAQEGVEAVRTSRGRGEGDGARTREGGAGGR